MFTYHLPTDPHKALKLLFKIAVALSVFSGTTHAATQGKLGHFSRAEIGVSLTIHPLIKVSGVQDIQLSAEQGEAIEGTTPVCVGGTYQGSYSIAARGGGGANDFILDSGEDTLSYAVTYSDSGGAVELQPSGSAASRPLAANLNCTAGANAKLSVYVDGTESAAATPGIYNGTLTLVVSPQ